MLIVSLLRSCTCCVNGWITIAFDLHIVFGSSHLKWKEGYDLKPAVVTNINYVRLQVKNGLTRYKNYILLTRWRKVIHNIPIANVIWLQTHIILNTHLDLMYEKNARCWNLSNLSSTQYGIPITFTRFWWLFAQTWIFLNCWNIFSKTKDKEK